MFITYHGHSQHFDQSLQRPGALRKARRPRVKGTRRPGTFVWRREPEKKKKNGNRSHFLVERDEAELLLPHHAPVATRSLEEVFPWDFGVDSPIATIHLGGLRTDPFDTYPIKTQTYFPPVVDFYLNIISTKSEFWMILQNDLLFESVITMTLCMMPKCLVSPAMATRTLYHHGSTLATLNKRLSLPSAEDCASDAVILTVACLIATNASLGDNDKFDTHITGLRQLVKLRGGLDCLPSKIQPIVLGAEALGSLSPAPRKAPSPYINTSAIPEYPKHPFPQDLCTLISSLPEGICELALTGRLSIQFIHRLDLSRNQLSSLLADADPSAKTEHWSKLLKSCTDFERTVWLSLACYHLRSTTYRSDLNKLAEAVIKYKPMESRAEQEWLLWTRTLLLGSSPGDLADETRSRVARRLLDNHAEAAEWCTLEKVARKFYWNASLAEESRKHWLDESSKYFRARTQVNTLQVSR